MTPANSVDRRSLLKLAAACASSLYLPHSSGAQASFGTDPFSLGVASGSPTHDSVVLWTRLLASGLLGSDLGSVPVTVRWELAHDEAFARIVQSGRSPARAELAHSVHAEVVGLEPDRWYFYRFIAGNAVSPTGRTRTFPAPGAEVARMRLAYASCQRWEHGYFSAYRHMREENLDAVVFLGDYIYEYPRAAKSVRIPSGGWVLTLDDYRQRYALHRSEIDLQRMHAACPWVVTWDDHEVQNDYAGSMAGNSGPVVLDFAARRAAAYQAFYEHMPLRASVLTRALEGLRTGAEMRIYDRIAWGRLATLYLLDNRQYRDPQACTRGGRAGSSPVNPAQCPNWNDPERTLLGAGQENWLDRGFAQGAADGVDAAVWNVVGQQTLFGRRDVHAGPGESFWNDAWDGYGPARGRFIASLQRHRVANPVLLGGDVHENWVGHVKADYARPDSAALGVEFCGTSISSRSDGNAKLPVRLAENPHFIFADSERRGYGVVDLTPTRLITSLRVVDDVTRRDTRVETLASFAVQAGRAVVERA